MRPLRVYSLNNIFTNRSAALTTVTVLYVMSLVHIYLTAGGLCLLTTFLQSTPSGNHKFLLLFYELVFFFFKLDSTYK